MTPCISPPPIACVTRTSSSSRVIGRFSLRRGPRGSPPRDLATCVLADVNDPDGAPGPTHAADVGDRRSRSGSDPDDLLTLGQGLLRPDRSDPFTQREARRAGMDDDQVIQTEVVEGVPHGR